VFNEAYSKEMFQHVGSVDQSHLFIHKFHDMFHDMSLKCCICGWFTICFTICLCVSPDLDGYRAPKMKH